jgi:hypothetical protein
MDWQLSILVRSHSPVCFSLLSLRNYVRQVNATRKDRQSVGFMSVNISFGSETEYLKSDGSLFSPASRLDVDKDVYEIQENYRQRLNRRVKERTGR